MLKRNAKAAEIQTPPQAEKVLDVDASMQGTLTFRDPVNLRINGNFEGVLDVRGMLTIGERASVKANITGEIIVIAGDVTGDVKADKELQLVAPGRLVGDVETPALIVERGAVLQGRLNMIGAGAAGSRVAHRIVMGVDELASYLAVEKALIFEWADSGKLPGVREGSTWKFDKSKVDEWVASGRIK
jgi:excisionase family DNA binding protein